MKALLKQKRGNLNKFQGLFLTVMVIGILAGITLLVLSTFQAAMTTDSVEFNATGQWLTAGANISAQAPTAGTLFGIGLIVVAAFAILGFMAFRGRGV